ncbi:hypothetical protein NLJ89_g8285 [Agrocybe chaxingu]|uniref:JmjC domain-containing protein n=1 Tax=Agrocybe chaxingu TaxID=84603 RepID=A0A9W8K2R3_9AGAR|nr:hypothetical protein NLJ89_g8285 [Agrocybe chaxingu]
MATREEQAMASATLSSQQASALVHQTRGERQFADNAFHESDGNNDIGAPPLDALETPNSDTTVTMVSSQVMISTDGWSLDGLLAQGKNFRHIRRVRAASSRLSEILKDHEQNGIPLVVEGLHEHRKWKNDMFTMECFERESASEHISVRNVHNWSDKTIPLKEFVMISRSAGPFAQENETERLYGKDADCPKHWENWLNSSGVVPPDVLGQGQEDLFRYRPETSPIETLMCYLGVGDTFTPCHKDLCASSGQNLMCYTENGGSSFWFMTEGPSAPEASRYFHELGQELDHENYVITVEELAKAPFKVYILEQKLGDLVLVPPRSCHQVVNYGGITIKTSWSRMTLKGLVCRYETYRIKSTIYYVLMGKRREFKQLLKSIAKPQATSSARKRKYKSDNASTPFGGRSEMDTLASELQYILSLYDSILLEESDKSTGRMPKLDDSKLFNDDARIVCDFCGCDVFQSFFECHRCVRSDSSEESYIICAGCYSEGRSCRCKIMKPMQCRDFKLLLADRDRVVKILDLYERSHDQRRSFASTLEFKGTRPDGFSLLVYNALQYQHCKPAKAQFMELGWYDASAQTHEMYEDDETISSTDSDSSYSPLQAASTRKIATSRSSSTSVLRILLPIRQVGNSGVATDSESVRGPSASPKKKIEVYIDVPPAPYRIPGSRYSTGKVVAADRSIQLESSTTKKQSTAAESRPATASGAPVASMSYPSLARPRQKTITVRLGEYEISEPGQSAARPAERILLAKSGLRVRLSETRREDKPTPRDVETTQKATTPPSSPQEPNSYRKKRLAGLRFKKLPREEIERSPSSSSASATVAASEDPDPVQDVPPHVDNRQQQIWNENVSYLGYPDTGSVAPPYQPCNYPNPYSVQNQYQQCASTVFAEMGHMMLGAADRGGGASTSIGPNAGQTQEKNEAQCSPVLNDGPSHPLLGNGVNPHQHTHSAFCHGNVPPGAPFPYPPGPPAFGNYHSLQNGAPFQHPHPTIPTGMVVHWDPVQRYYVIPGLFPPHSSSWMTAGGVPPPFPPQVGVPPAFLQPPQAAGPPLQRLPHPPPHPPPHPISEAGPSQAPSSHAHHKPYGHHVLHPRDKQRYNRRREDQPFYTQAPYSVVPYFDGLDHSILPGQENREMTLTELAQYQPPSHAVEPPDPGPSGHQTPRTPTQLRGPIISMGKMEQLSLSPVLSASLSPDFEESCVPEPAKTPPDPPDPEAWEEYYEQDEPIAHPRPVFVAGFNHPKPVPKGTR